LFAFTITGGSFLLLEPEVLGSYYDHLSNSLLDFRLDVPAEAIGSEAMIFEGRHYGYFGPTPALLRIPFTLTGLYFGRLTRLLMTGYFVLFLTGVYFIYLDIKKRFTPSDVTPGTEQVIILMTAAGVGSSAYFLSGRAFIYHEAALCGVMFATWSVLATLRWIYASESKTALFVAFICGLLALHARPTTGLFAFTTLCCASIILIIPAFNRLKKQTDRRVIQFILIGTLSICGVLSISLLNYFKFRSFESLPLRYHISYTPDRLARTEGRLFSLDNIPFNFSGYMLPPNIQFHLEFPFLVLRRPVTDDLLHRPTPNDFPKSRIDYAENTIPVPLAMPTLMLLTIMAYSLTWSRLPATRVLLLTLLGGMLPMALTLFAIFIQAHRYTADFVPYLVVASSYGLIGMGTLSVRGQRLIRVVVLTSCIVNAALSIVVTLFYQMNCVWGVAPDIQKNQHILRAWIEALIPPNIWRPL